MWPLDIPLLIAVPVRIINCILLEFKQNNKTNIHLQFDLISHFFMKCTDVLFCY